MISMGVRSVLLIITALEVILLTVLRNYHDTQDGGSSGHNEENKWHVTVIDMLLLSYARIGLLLVLLVWLPLEGPSADDRDITATTGQNGSKGETDNELETELLQRQKPGNKKRLHQTRRLDILFSNQVKATASIAVVLIIFASSIYPIVKIAVNSHMHQNSLDLCMALISFIAPALESILLVLYLSNTMMMEEQSTLRGAKSQSDKSTVDHLLSEDDYIALGNASAAKMGDKAPSPNYLASLWTLQLKSRKEVERLNEMDSKFRGKGTSVRRVISLAWPERYMLSFAFFCLVVCSVSQMIIPTLFGQLIQTISDGNPAAVEQNQQKLNHTVLVMILIFALTSFFGMLRGSLFNLCGERVVARLRVRLFTRLIGQDIAFFDSTQSGELQSRLSNDATVLQDSVTSNISIALRYSGQAVVGIIILFALSWKLTLIMLLVVPVIAIGGRHYGSFMRTISKTYQGSLAKAADRAEESLSLVRTVKSFSKEEYEQGRYADCIETSYRQGVKKSFAYGAFLGVIGMAVYTAIAVVLWYGGKIVISSVAKASDPTHDDLTPSQLTSFMLYTIYIAGALGALTGLYSQVMVAVGASERIFELIDQQPLVVSGPKYKDSKHLGEGDDEALLPSSTKVEFKAVVFKYPTRADALVLDSMSFTLEKHRITAFVGPSGGGKSTIVSLILRWYDPLSGIITFDGIPLQELDLNWVRSQIAVVSQEPLLFSTSILENIRYGSISNQQGAVSMTPIVEAAKKANAHDFIMSFPDGYDTQVGERGVQLSGGQKQRLAIARAVLRRPKLLLLDEATSALDSESEEIVQQALDRLMFANAAENEHSQVSSLEEKRAGEASFSQQSGMTTLVIAHRLSTVKNADKIIVVHHGKVVQEGKHSELMADPTSLYATLVEKQDINT